MDYDVTVLRRWYTERSTVSELLVPGISMPLFCLEDPVRDGPKIPGETAIPAGRYQLTFYDSPRFKRRVLLLHDVPNFSFIEFHPGNKPEDTHGCLLPGCGRGPDIVYGSRQAFAMLLARCEWEHQGGKDLYVRVEDGPRES